MTILHSHLINATGLKNIFISQDRNGLRTSDLIRNYYRAVRSKVVVISLLSTCFLLLFLWAGFVYFKPFSPSKSDSFFIIISQREYNYIGMLVDGSITGSVTLQNGLNDIDIAFQQLTIKDTKNFSAIGESFNLFNKATKDFFKITSNKVDLSLDPIKVVFAGNIKTNFCKNPTICVDIAADLLNVDKNILNFHGNIVGDILPLDDQSITLKVFAENIVFNSIMKTIHSPIPIHFFVSTETPETKKRYNITTKNLLIASAVHDGLSSVDVTGDSPVIAVDGKSDRSDSPSVKIMAETLQIIYDKVLKATDMLLRGNIVINSIAKDRVTTVTSDAAHIVYKFQTFYSLHLQNNIVIKDKNIKIGEITKIVGNDATYNAIMNNISFSNGVFFNNNNVSFYATGITYDAKHGAISVTPVVGQKSQLKQRVSIDLQKSPT